MYFPKDVTIVHFFSAFSFMSHQSVFFIIPVWYLSPYYYYYYGVGDGDRSRNILKIKSPLIIMMSLIQVSQDNRS